MNRLIVVLAMSVFLLTGQLVLADTPQLINYQGVLSDSYGQPLDGGYYLMFTIYDAPSDPSSILWQEGRTVTVSYGLFNVTLGSIVPLSDTVFNDTGRYLGIRVGTGEPEISPRTPLVSSPYAFRVKTVDGATGGHIYGDVTLHSVFEVVDNAAINLRDHLDVITVLLDAHQSPDGGALGYFKQHNGMITIGLDAEDGEGGGGQVYIGDNDGTHTIFLDAQAPEGGATSYWTQQGGMITIGMDAQDDPGQGGLIFVGDYDGTHTILLDGHEHPYGGAKIIATNGSGMQTISLDANDNFDNAAIVTLYDAEGDLTVHLDASGTGDAEGGAQLSLCDNNGTTTISLDAESMGADGGASVVLRTGTDPSIGTIHLDADDGGDGGGKIILQTAGGDPTIKLDADYGDGLGRMTTDVLEIKGGADLSEQFEVRSDLSDHDVAPGMLVCIDPENPGKLVLSSKAYDPTVAGIISGAGGIQPGMLMGQTGSISDGQHAVALTGRVYCRADASFGSIKPGDFLTTSPVPGHAMLARDRNRSYGAVIGKAMTSLEQGAGLVLVLVNLQ